MSVVDPDDFERCWHETVHGVMAYARRHVGEDAAPDITSAVFLTAWRTWAQVPDPAMPWLLSVAWGQVRNHRRAVRRNLGLHERLELLDRTAYRGSDTALTAEERLVAISAIASLPIDQREALLLVCWDGLTSDQAAAVLGCRPSAFRTRLHRARQRLDEALGEPIHGTIGDANEGRG